MSNNQFYTVMIVPEKTAQVRRLVIPAWLVKTGAVAIAFAALFTVVMFFDYWYVMSQISENKQLKMENRRLRQQVQVFKNKVVTIESTMERVKTFATRLKVITNIEDRGGLLQSLNGDDGKLPDATANVGKIPVGKLAPPIEEASSSTTTTTAAAVASPLPASDSSSPAQNSASAAEHPTATRDLSAGFTSLLDDLEAENPEDALLRKDYNELDGRLSDIGRESLYVEQMLQDQYELLADQKAFLAALPTRKPVIGYYTSGFGIRPSPYGGRVKMHEGLDIANHAGTFIKAPADGVVVWADTKAGYGNTVVLDHGYGLETWYGHTRKILVSKGQRVRRGDTIALMGSTGRSTGPHVHYEVRVHGTPVDPLSYILEGT